MARVVMFDVMGARWLLTDSVGTTRVGELDAADVVAIVGDGDHVSIHKSRNGTLVVDTILKRAILRHWHGEAAAELVKPPAPVMPAPPNAQQQLLAELGRFRDTELKMRAMLRAQGGETTLQAVDRVYMQAHNADLNASYVAQARDRALADVKARDMTIDAADEALARAGIETGISLGYRIDKLAQRVKTAVTPIESWAPAWVERVTKLRATLYRDVDARPKATIAYEYGAELPWRASMPGVLGVGHRSERARSPEGAAELLEEGLRRELQERIDAARGELDTLAKSLEER